MVAWGALVHRLTAAQAASLCAIMDAARRESEARPRKLSFSDSEMQPTSTDCKEEFMRAYVRVKPVAPGARSVIQVTENECVLSTSKTTAQGGTSTEDHSFAFNAVFDADATQAQVYEQAMHQVAAEQPPVA